MRGRYKAEYRVLPLRYSSFAYSLLFLSARRYGRIVKVWWTIVVHQTNVRSCELQTYRRQRLNTAEIIAAKNHIPSTACE